MDEIKTKFLDLIHKQKNHVKIPAMGFSEYFVQNVTTESQSTGTASGGSGAPTISSTNVEQTESEAQKPDQELLESIDDVYFGTCDISLHELQRYQDTKLDLKDIEKTVTTLNQQLQAVSKKVLQKILEKRGACNDLFAEISNTEKDLEEAVWSCKKGRSYLSFAKTHLSAKSLEALYSYKRRENIIEVLGKLEQIRIMRSAEIDLQNLLCDNNYSGAIALILKCQNSAADYENYDCVDSLNDKLRETLMLAEYQLTEVLSQMVLHFNMKKYSNLQEAYKLLNNSLFAMDQLHINYISAIHSSFMSVLRSYNEPLEDDKQALLLEKLCENVSLERYITCLISVCKTFWKILASYYQIVNWHQNYKLYPDELNDSQDKHIEEKLKKGQTRIWNDMQSKICVYLSSTNLKLLKFDQFIQVLSIIQRLQKIGVEFCGEHSQKLISTMQTQSEEFFNRYHLACLEEICLFLDNESWTSIDSFSNILQLQEYRSVQHALRRQKSPPSERKFLSQPTDSASAVSANCDELVSVHSQDAVSSMYDSCGYFLRFSEKSSPFDGGLDASMLEEDILSGIVDEASCYFTDSDDEKSAHNKSDEEIIVSDEGSMIATNTSLNVLRCIGRYLQMCKLLHCISPKIVNSMFELIDFYGFAVHEIFCKDATVQIDNFYTPNLISKLKYVQETIIPKIRMWPLNFSSLTNNELANPETLYGLSLRVIAIESELCMVKQFQLLNSYLKHLLPPSEHDMLSNIPKLLSCFSSVSKPIYICVASRVIDLQATLLVMGKTKWEIDHITVQHSKYIDSLCRNVQNFAMRLEEISKIHPVPAEDIWNSVAHVSTHLLVEGFSNVKKCTAGGRALMQLDYTYFINFLELIPNIKFKEHNAYVEAYVKAFYYPPDLLEEWIVAQKIRNDYSSKQLATVIQGVCIGDKRRRQKLLEMLEKENLNETQ